MKRQTARRKQLVSSVCLTLFVSFHDEISSGLSGIKILKHSFRKLEKNHTHDENKREKKEMHNLC